MVLVHIAHKVCIVKAGVLLHWTSILPVTNCPFGFVFQKPSFVPFVLRHIPENWQLVKLVCLHNMVGSAAGMQDNQGLSTFRSTTFFCMLGSEVHSLAALYADHCLSALPFGSSL